MKQLLFWGVLLGPLLALTQQLRLQGKILGDDAAPLPGATITLQGSSRSTVSDSRGLFTLTGATAADTLVITSVGYAPRKVAATQAGTPIILARLVGVLDEAVVMAYGTTTRRLSTGTIARVSGEEIRRQPVHNPLTALQGRVPGLVVTQASGVTGAAVSVQLRGQSSIAQGSEPLYVIDGVPFGPGNEAINTVHSAVGTAGLSPFSSLNPADIESIEVLKDADATAIYGSRGAGGVILITTKKGRPGKTTLSASVYQGQSLPTRLPRMLSTAEYLQMRREALQNDGVAPTPANAPDLKVWDTTRYTDFQKYFSGGRPATTDAQLSLAGGSAAVRFFLGAGYHRQGDPFPGSRADVRQSLHTSTTYASPDNKLSVQLSAAYAVESNDLTSLDLTAYIKSAPNLPPLQDEGGRLLWESGGVGFSNPMAFERITSQARIDQGRLQLQWSYELLPGLAIGASAGANRLTNRDQYRFPKEAQNPVNAPQGRAQFGDHSVRSFTVEPQADYRTTLGGGRLQVLLGGSLQQTDGETTFIEATGYTHDALLGTLAGASALTGRSTAARYRYAALFGRLTYQWKDRYLLNLSGRRDGSSRFGPGRRYAQFGAVGAGWIFSQARWLRDHLPVLSFGKLRGSYGTTGNDQIGNYGYLDSWNPVANPYGGVPALTPARLFNPDYGWEVTRKAEAALELGFWQDRLLLTGTFFRARSSNQLIAYMLPAQSGFSSVLRNFPAEVENRGWELTATARGGKALRWTASAHLTVPRNRLVSFPGLAATPYAARYVEGEPLSVLRTYKYLGVDPQTGLFSFLDVDKDGVMNGRDMVVTGQLAPRWYGGWSHSLTFRGLQLDASFDVRRQTGRSPLASLYSFLSSPGAALINQPSLVLERWQRPGDHTDIQKFTASFGTPAFRAASLFVASDGMYTDASYVRLRNLALSWTLPGGLQRRLHTSGARLYLQGQNLLTLTPYSAGDPETQNLYSLPPLRTLTAGLQLTF